MFATDTIAALSTAPGLGLRAIVRMSGPKSLSIAASLLPDDFDLEGLPGYSAPQVTLSLREGGLVSAQLLLMRAPRSYTTEDVIEFHLPGSLPLSERLLADCLDAGARLAEPGEFTLRAYRGGRITADQVEGILGLIESRSDSERKAALHLLEGSPSRETAAVRRDLLEVLAAIEAYLDFTDEDTEEVESANLRRRLEQCRDRLRRIAAPLNRKLPLRGRDRVVLLGPPNAGKSSLFRRLVPTSRVLTSQLPGTTRDLIEGEVSIEGTPFLLFDAPGIMQSRDPLERLAQSRLFGMMGRMDAGLLVFDGSCAPSYDVLREVMVAMGPKPCLAVLNKNDLEPHPEWDEIRFEMPSFRISAAGGFGVDEMLQSLVSLLPESLPQAGSGIDFQLNQALSRAGAAIDVALQGDWDGGLELIAMEVREATQAIGSLSSPVTDEEILQAVFSRFCIGK